MNDRRFELDRKWHGLRGTAFGLHQPALIGRASVGDLTAEDLERLEARAQACRGIQLQPFEPRTDLTHRFAFRVLDWIGALQRQARVPVSERVHLQLQGRSASDGGRLVVQLALANPNPQAARIALPWVAAQLPLILGAPGVDERSLKDADWLQAQLQPFGEPGLNRFHILQAAQRLDIPTLHLTPRVMALGTGAHLRLLTSTTTDHTPNISVAIAMSKSQTATVLRLAGLPGAQHLAARTADEAVAAAARIGYPVVVKPDDLEKGRGVRANLVRAEQVAEAWAAARALSERVLVERWVDGSTHRLTVFHGRVIRSVRRLAGGVIGDGVHDVQALVALKARTEQDRPATGLQGSRPVRLDAEALELLSQGGLTPQHVPAAGVHVRLRRRDNINAGGRNVELAATDVHPDNLRLAVEAAALLKLDFAGIDLISTDIGQSWIDSGATICEVNAMPQMGVGGDPRIYEMVLSELMGGRLGVPVHLVLCPAEPARRQQAVAACVREAPDAGVSDLSGLWLQGRRITRPFEQGFDAARALLMRTEVTRAVCVMSTLELASSGFPVHRVDRLSVALREKMTDDERSLLPRVTAMARVSPGPAELAPA